MRFKSPGWFRCTKLLVVCLSVMFVACTIGAVVSKQFAQDSVGKSLRPSITASTQTLAPRSSHQDFEPVSSSNVTASTQTLAPRSSHQDFEPVSSSNVTNNTERLSLVISHFSLPPRRTSKHYPEIEDAIRINLANPVVSEVVIMYDTQNAVLDGCKEMEARLLAGFAKKTVSQQARLRCVERKKQPSYRELLNFASATVRPGSVVVVGNADGTMDHTAKKLTRIQEGHAVVLTVTRTLAPAAETISKAQALFRLARCRAPHRCFPYKNYGAPPSFDAYAFRAPIPFINDTTLPDGIYINSVYAESWAGRALDRAGLRVHNICRHVAWISLHCAEHMHRGGARQILFVPKMCNEIDQCLGLST